MVIPGDGCTTIPGGGTGGKPQRSTAAVAETDAALQAAKTIEVPIEASMTVSAKRATD